TEPAKKSYVETVLGKESGAFIAVSDNVRTVPDQIAPWVPGGLFTLGTDGFGRSDTRTRCSRRSSDQTLSLGKRRELPCHPGESLISFAPPHKWQDSSVGRAED